MVQMPCSHSATAAAPTAQSGALSRRPAAQSTAAPVSSPQPELQPDPEVGLSSLSAATAAAAWCWLSASAALPPHALADTLADVASYDNAAGSENLKTVFGVGYVILVAIFAVRLLRKRAGRAKTEVG